MVNIENILQSFQYFDGYGWVDSIQIVEKEYDAVKLVALVVDQIINN